MSVMHSQTRGNEERIHRDTLPAKYGLEVSEEAVQPIQIQLCARIERVWQENVDCKQRVEEELLQCLRDRKGVYSPEELATIREQGSSDIFMKLPQVKQRAAEAHIRAILIPDDQMAFGIEPTPVQSLPEFMSEAIINRVLQNQQRVDGSGQQMDPIQQVGALQHMVKEEVEAQGKLACERMEKKIADQLTEGDWHKELTSYISDFVTFPTAIMKGPIFEARPVRKWVRDESGHRLERSIENKMVFKTISPFDAYPSANAESPQDGDFIERIRMRRGELHALLGMPGYNDTAIQDVLIEHGQSGLHQWLWTDSQRAHLTNKEHFWLNTAHDEIDALHYWGRAQGVELLEWGMPASKITDPLADYEIDAIKIGRHIIRAEVNNDPEFRRPLHSASYESVPGSFWGNAIAFLMRDISRMCNSAARQLQNNMAFSSGMQIEIAYNRLAPESGDPHVIYPNRVWQVVSSEFGGNDPAVRFFQPTSNAAELMQVYNEFHPQADDATGIPRYAHGNEEIGGAGDTAKGLSMLMDSSAKMLRASIANIDDGIISPTVKMVYDWNMENDPDESIKGDAQVVAKGANAMLQRESAREAQMQFLELTANEVDMEIIGKNGRAAVLRGLVNTYPSMPQNVVPTQEELDHQAAQQQQQPPPPEILKIEADKEMAAAKLEQEGQLNQQKMEQTMQIERMRLDLQMEKAKMEAQTDIQRERMIQDFKSEGLEQEIADKARGRVQELQAQKEIASEQTKAQADTAKATAETTANAQQPVDDQVTEEEVKSIVVAAVEPLVKKIDDLSSTQMKAIMDLIKNVTKQVKPT